MSFVEGVRNYSVVVIGGRATGVGVFRDLCMRGVNTLLVEQKDLAYGTSSRFHGLLHSGGRYAVKDPESAKECREENLLLRSLAKHCIEETEGYFVRLPEDDAAFEQKWLAACMQLGIEEVPIEPQMATVLEPGLSPRIISAYRVPDAAIDGFRLVWQNTVSARKYGGTVRTYTRVIDIKSSNGCVDGITVQNTLTGEVENIGCSFIVNAAGSWAAKVAGLAGIRVEVKPDKGTLLAFNHRFTSRIINRLRPPSDGDIFVPHGSVTILGTTSSPANGPEDMMVSTAEVNRLLDIGKELFEALPKYRILRAFAGTRPLYSVDTGTTGREVSRNFTIIDHSLAGLAVIATIVGGKFTTYRLMAEKMTDFVCKKLSITAQCRTRTEPLLEDAASGVITEGRKLFPAYSFDQAASRLGAELAVVLEAIKADKAKQHVCECEMVTLAEIELAAKDETSFSLEDIRRKTRLGMGTCQGAFCGFRSIGAVMSREICGQRNTVETIQDFLQSRWAGIRPVLWGGQLREAELMRGIYEATLNIDGEIKNE